MSHTSGNKWRARVVTVTLDKIDFNSKTVKRQKKSLSDIEIDSSRGNNNCKYISNKHWSIKLY